MISAFALALRQLPDPAFLGPLLKGLLAAVAVFLGLAGLAAYKADDLKCAQVTRSSVVPGARGCKRGAS